MSLKSRLKNIADARWFQNTITFFILLAGIIVGIETYPEAMEAHGGLLHFLNALILWIFVAEIVVKMGAEGKAPWRYFNDPWNIFDFIIVAVCFIPIDAQYVAVLRLARLLRVLKLVRALPKLQILVSALLKSIPSMGYVALLLGILFYLYAVAAVFLFSQNDPAHFKDLPVAMLSLFRIVTGDGWTDIMYIQMHGCDKFGYDDMQQLCIAPKAQPLLGSLFFVSFMLVGAMVILNLFIGVIMGGMEEARRETEAFNQSNAQEPKTLPQELSELQVQLREIQDKLGTLQAKLSDAPEPGRGHADGSGEGTESPGQVKALKGCVL